MPGPTEHKTVQARILAYAEAIGWTFVSLKAVFVSRLRRAKVSCRRDLNHKERREHKEDLDSGPLSSLRSLRLFNSEFRGLNRRERRERKEDLDWLIWRQAVARFPGREFCHSLWQNLSTACRQILEQAVQEMNRAPVIS